MSPNDDSTAELAVRRTPGDVVLMPVMDVARAKQRLVELQDFCAGYLQESKDGGQDGGDFGIIPGAGKKKVLLKSGAEKLCDVYGLADRYRILSKVEDFVNGLFDYTIECELVRKTDEMFVGSGLGSCSSYESKYRWRDASRKCPQCGGEYIIKGKAEFGGGWLCWKKKGGCGAMFSDTDTGITEQKVGRTENPDITDTKNTVLKIAKKRAKIDAVIGVTRSSGLFTQDLEEHETAGYTVTAPTGPPSAIPPTQETREATPGPAVREDAGPFIPPGEPRRIMKVTPGWAGGKAKGFLVLDNGEELPIYNDKLKAAAEQLCQDGVPVIVERAHPASGKPYAKAVSKALAATERDEPPDLETEAYDDESVPF